MLELLSGVPGLHPHGASFVRGEAQSGAAAEQAGRAGATTPPPCRELRCKYLSVEKWEFFYLFFIICKHIII